MPDDERQSERRQAEQNDDDEGYPEIPWQRVRAGKWGRCVVKRSIGFIEELAAVLAFDSLVLDILGAVRALFHGSE